MRKKSPYSELFYSVFSRIRTEYGEIRRDAARITPNMDRFHAVIIVLFKISLTTSLISKRITLLLIQALTSDVKILKPSNFMGMSHCSRWLDAADS